MICSRKARQNIQVFATIHENFVVLLVPGFLSARFVCGNGLWWKVYTSARPYRTRWTLPNSQQFLQEGIFPAVRWGRPKFSKMKTGSRHQFV